MGHQLAEHSTLPTPLCYIWDALLETMHASQRAYHSQCDLPTCRTDLDRNTVFQCHPTYQYADLLRSAPPTEESEQVEVQEAVVPRCLLNPENSPILPRTSHE